MCAWPVKERCLSSERVLGAGSCLPQGAWPLYSVAHIRAMETQAAAALPPHTLMQRAGLALAQLALALAPHAKRFWIACGPGNNGGDGFEAAMHLQAWGKSPHISYLPVAAMPADAAESLQRARAAGVPITDAAPSDFDCAIDALFGIGSLRPMGETHRGWTARMNAAGVTVLAVDNPSGLDVETGAAAKTVVHATATLSFLGLKPGLFTAQGRDVCGEIWCNTLQVAAREALAAELNPAPDRLPRLHDSHKGSFGDVTVVGGDTGMLGAALLAARSALYQGAGRVYLAALDPQAPGVDLAQPEIMFRSPSTLAWPQLTVVAGCGGGARIAAWLPQLARDSAHLVLDADGLNALATSADSREHVRQRRADTTVLTPHPLEAARLLQCTPPHVQANRLPAAQALAEMFQATVVLKGSGTVIAAPGRTPRINPTGNARLATGGTGDVLAGMVGASMSAGLGAYDAASAAVYRHGQAANEGTAQTGVVLASELLRRCTPA